MRTRLLARLLGLVLGLTLFHHFALAAARPAAAPTVSTPCANGALGCPGEWSPVIKFDPAVVAIHAHLLPNGKVLFWAPWGSTGWDGLSPSPPARGAFSRSAASSKSARPVWRPTLTAGGPGRGRP